MAKKSDSPGGREQLLSARRSARKSQGEGNGSDYWRQIRANKRASNKGKGCSTKLFMLALPLIAVGAYLLHLS